MLGVKSVAVMAVLASLGGVWAYPGGPPTEVCGSMYPTGHTNNTILATQASPYSYKFSHNTYCSGGGVRVTLEPAAEGRYKEYEGIFFQARCSPRASANCTDGIGLGTWTLEADDESQLKVMNCGQKTKNAVGHKSKVKKQQKTLTWKPEAGFTEPIVIIGTWVRETDEFWVNVTSTEVTYKEECETSVAANVVLPSALLLMACVLALH